MFTAIVVDDDEFSCNLVSEMVKNYFPEIEMKAEARSFYSGIKEIYKHRPNLVFMDMELPDGKGYEIFNMTFLYPFKVIFITAHKDYAYEAINYSPAGYIIKPVSVCNFLNAVHKALPHMDDLSQPTMDSDPALTDKIVVKTTESIHVIHKKQIVRCEACRNYTTIYQHDEKEILASHTLKDFESLLPYPQYIRVHQSHLVNTDYIKRIDKTDSSLFLADNSRVPIACRKRDQLMDYIKSIDTN